MSVKANKTRNTKHRAISNHTNSNTSVALPSETGAAQPTTKVNSNKGVLSHNIQLLINVLVLVVSIVALFIANNSYQSTTIQNEKIVDNLKNIQLITEKQTDIINQQLQISNQIYYDQLNAGSPKLVIKHIELTDERYVDGKYSPLISIIIKNEGKRYAFNFKNRITVIQQNNTMIRTSNFTNIANIIGPIDDNVARFKPRLDSITPIPFYCCFEMIYLDNSTGKNINDVYYYEYRLDRDKKEFFFCADTTAKRIKILLNKYFKSDNQPLIQS